MRKFKINAAGVPQVPWHESATLEDFDGDQEEFEAYLDELADMYEDIAVDLRPGQPHPMDYEDQQYSDQYQSDMRIFEQTAAMDAHRAKHEPPKQLEPDQHALYYGSGEDRKQAQERLEMKKFVAEQLQKAAEHRARGNLTAAFDCEDRAAQYTRDIEKREREYSYSFVEEEDRNVIDYGARELSAMIHWPSEKVKHNEARIRGMIEGYRQMSDTEHSFVLTKDGGNYKVTKVLHPGTPANEIKARVGEFSDETYLRKLSAHGTVEREEPEPEEAPSEPAEPAPTKQSHVLEKTIAPGILP
jgi:hypothetical protein